MCEHTEMIKNSFRESPLAKNTEAAFCLVVVVFLSTQKSVLSGIMNERVGRLKLEATDCITCDNLEIERSETLK